MLWNLRSLVDEFLKCISLVNAPGTITYYRRHLERFIVHVGEINVADLKPLHLLSWGRSWHQMQSVQRLFHWAATEAEVIPTNPFRKCKKPRPGERRRTLSGREMASLLRATDAPFRSFLVAMRETIGRPQEIRVLCWEHIRQEDERKTLAQSLADGSACFELLDYKGRSRRIDPGKPRLLLISPRLARLLLRMMQRGTLAEGPVFLNSQGRAWTTNAIRLRMRRLRDRLGWKRDGRGEHVVAYTLRHTQATAAAAHGVRDKVLAEVMGHTSTRTTARYQHLDISHLRAAMDRFRGRRNKGL